MSHHAMHNPLGGFYGLTPTDSVQHEYDGPGVATCIDCTMRFCADDAKPCVDCKDDLCPECHKGHGGKCATCHCSALDGAA